MNNLLVHVSYEQLASLTATGTMRSEMQAVARDGDGVWLTPEHYAAIPLPAAQPPWTIDQPSRGLGDTLAKLANRLGIAWAVHRYWGTCGCARRQAWLNKLFPYQTAGLTETRK